MNTFDCIKESLRIEGIYRDPTPGEIETHMIFLELARVTVANLKAFVSVYQPGAQLRERPGMDIRIGVYVPPRGGPEVRARLEDLLERCNDRTVAPWQAHCEYECLHPFMDGNGRSGRMLWYWMMGVHGAAHLGFLHTFYYQTLAAVEPLVRPMRPVRLPEPRADRVVDSSKDDDWAVGSGGPRHGKQIEPKPISEEGDRS